METPTKDGDTERLGPKDVLIAQLNDLLRMKANIIGSLRKELDQMREAGLDTQAIGDMRQELQALRGQQGETVSLLRMKENMLKLARQEVELLKEQLGKEKENFEIALKKRDHQYRVQLNESSYTRDQCEGLKRLCEEQRHAMKSKDEEIETLRKQLRKVKEGYSQDKQGLQVKHQQELFIARKLVK